MAAVTAARDNRVCEGVRVVVEGGRAVRANANATAKTNPGRHVPRLMTYMPQDLEAQFGFGASPSFRLVGGVGPGQLTGFKSHNNDSGRLLMLRIALT